MKCLACWRDISEQDKNCPFCGTNQEEMKSFLALSLMIQKGKIESGEIKGSFVDFLEKVDPTKTKEIKEKMKKAETKQPVSPYVPTQLSPLQPYTPIPVGNQKSSENISKPIITQDAKLPTVICPKCNNEVKLRKYCKYCGNQLLIECLQCGAEVKATYKFCPKCGAEITSKENSDNN
ncbi:MAG: zinc ribbon domain-containing protein [Candidatus Heimdallarchaeaceae archaeon]